MSKLTLAEAILIGDSLKRPSNDQWLSDDGHCGCAFGGVLLASGLTGKEWSKAWRSAVMDSVINNTQQSPYDIAAELACVKARWPWLTAEHLSKITNLYQNVIDGKGTIEEIADYAASIEPKSIETTVEAEAIYASR